ncbi:hypothetical protein GCM10011316_39650 [Roseibium aquae]|uniref:Uncharacterized protein n=1 Tax=Roseibium aquae TaxID=1323746 RepID=A0A916TP34_9HYPH|nr:hypothetical protein GCM10011316_39650 [Roseibium aquae]
MKIENRPLTELKVSYTVEMGPLVPADDLYVFASASGNHNPIHLTNQHHDGKSLANDPVAALIAYLCSDTAAQITGSPLPIDGGWTAH